MEDPPEGPVGRLWFSLAGLHMVPDPQRTRAAEKGIAHAHQNEGVQAARSRFDGVDARDWLAPSGVLRVFASVGFVSNLRDVPLVDLGRRTHSRDLSLVAVHHKSSLGLPVDELADAIVARLLDGFERMSQRYGLGPFPVPTVGG